MKLYMPSIRTFILGRYGSLLLILLCLFIFQPLVDTLGGRFLIEALFIGALIAGLRAIEIKRELFRFEVFLMAGSIICFYAGSMMNNTMLFRIGIAGESIFLTMVAMTLLGLYKAKKVSGDTLA